MPAAARIFRVLAAASLVAAGAAQAKPLAVTEKLATYRAEIRRTPFGIPHVKADDWEGLGFGAGIATAEDTICELYDRMLTASATRAFHLGRGANDANVQSDLFYARHRIRVRAWLDGDPSSVETPSREARAIVRGFVAGVSHYVRAVGRDAIPDPRCRGAPWVREIDELDYWTFVSTYLGFANQSGVVAAVPPGGTSACPAGSAALSAAPGADPVHADPEASGSNAYGLGREVTQNGRGVLLGNPHYPWTGPNRFYRMHLTIPGALNVVGAGLINMPFVGIGHTDRIAWTHTVSTARRFGYFELTLDPSTPTRYWYEGAWRDMTPVCVSVRVREGDGTITTASRAFYDTRFGAMVHTATFPWTAARGFAVREATAGLRGLDQYLAIYRARDVRELAAALNRYGATAFNTTAVDADGEAFYGDVGGVPHVTEAQAAACVVSPTGAAQWAARIPVLDGSRAECDWGSDPGAVPGLAGLATAPHLFRSDYVTQSNDSYWLTNPAQPLEGFSRVFGDERTARSLRTRMGLRMVAERVAGTDGLAGARFDLGTVQDVLYSDRQLGAELARDALVAACPAQVTIGGQAVGLAQACAVLAAWDLRDRLDSRGAALWRLFAVPITPGVQSGLVWRTPFDVNDPVHTPRDLDTASPRVWTALGSAVLTLQQAGIPLDARLGDVQGVTRRGERIPIHGGSGTAGVFNVIGYAGFQPGAGWTDVVTGSSWIMTVQFTDEGPRSQGVLTYSQSTNPESVHSSDQTKLYSSYGWEDLYYSEAAVEAAAVSSKVVTEGAEDCKKGGWARFEVPAFGGQDECVSYFSELRGGVGRR